MLVRISSTVRLLNAVAHSRTVQVLVWLSDGRSFSVRQAETTHAPIAGHPQLQQHMVSMRMLHL